MHYPKVTFAILSWNRLHYLRATLESARRCIQYPNIEWIVSDNMSIEPGLQEYINGFDWIDHAISKRQTHAEAMNQIVSMASGEYLALWPDDMQFTVEGEWLADIIEILSESHNIGSVCLNHMRKVTLQTLFRQNPLQQWRLFIQEIKTFGTKFRRPRTIESSRGLKLWTYGWMKPGICGSGIPSLTPLRVWRDLGPWQSTMPTSKPLIDSSLGAEEDMVYRFFKARKPLQGAALWIPVAADIITDPTGCKAKVRGKYRYGVYMPPPNTLFYYEITSLSSRKKFQTVLPVDFTTGVKPLGFEIPLDQNGDRRKHDFNESVVFDIDKNVEVQYPLDLANESRSFAR